MERGGGIGLDSSDRDVFAARLNEARIARHLSINDVAKIAGVPKATAQGWLNGSHLPTPALRKRYLRIVEELDLTAELPPWLWMGEWARIEPRLRSAEAPYVGLRPFEARDSEFYYGRDLEARKLAEAILTLQDPAAGILAVIGASGSGKSSLLAAGLIGRECVTGVLAGWRPHLFTPESLAGETPEADLLVLDQLEEYLQRPGAERERAIADLARHARCRPVVVALRSDYFAAAGAEPVLLDALTRPVLVSPLTRTELIDVIVEPAKAMGVVVDDDLVHVLLNDIAPGSQHGEVSTDALPLLSNALLLTWAAGGGDRMTLSDYRGIGGMATAVETLAEEVYQGLVPAGRTIAQRLFLRLLGITHGTVIRRPVQLRDLHQDERVVADSLVATRMLTMNQDDLWISHEALLRHWSRLAAWIEEYRAELDSLARLRRAAELWEDSGQDPNVLIPVQRLPLFTDWMVDPKKTALLGRSERDFLAASEDHFASALREEQQVNRRLRRQRRLALGLAAVTTLTAIGAGVFFVRGEGYRAEITTARNDAESRQVAVSARSLRSKSPNLVAQLALVSLGLADTREARSMVLDADAMEVPLRWTGTASAVLAVSPSSQVVARADGGGKVTIWHGDELVTTPGTVLPVDPAGGGLLGVALASREGRELMAVGGTNVRALWDVTAEPRLLAELDSPGAVSAVGFDPDANRVVFGDADGVATVYSLADPGSPEVLAKAELKQPESPTQVRAVALDRTGMLYVSGRLGEIGRWRLDPTLQELSPLTVKSADRGAAVMVQALAVTADGRRLAAGVAGSEVFRWQMAADHRLAAEPTLTSFTSYINAVAYSADEAQLAVASSDQSVSIYDAVSGAELRRMVTPAIQTGVGFAFDGRPVSVGTDGTLEVWATRSPLWRVSGAPVFNLATDGTQWLAAGGVTDGITLWRLGEDEQRMPAPVAPELPSGDLQRGAVGVAPDGTYLVGGTLGGKVLSWRSQTAAPGQARPTTRVSRTRSPMPRCHPIRRWWRRWSTAAITWCSSEPTLRATCRGWR